MRIDRPQVTQHPEVSLVTLRIPFMGDAAETYTISNGVILEFYLYPADALTLAGKLVELAGKLLDEEREDANQRG